MLKGVVALDIGPSKYAIVAPHKQFALLGRFCHQLESNEKKLHRIQKKLARQQRANNPDNYEPNFQDKYGHWKKGKVKTGAKTWIVSKRQQREYDALREEYRKLAETRKSLQLQLKNLIIQLGDTYHFERVSIKTWQKLWGRSIGHRAPGQLRVCPVGYTSTKARSRNSSR